MGRGREIEARRRDGSEFPVEIGLAPAQTERGLVVTATVLDMSERRATRSASSPRVSPNWSAPMSGSRNSPMSPRSICSSRWPRSPSSRTRLEAAMAAGDGDGDHARERRMRHCALGARRLVEDLLTYARTIYGDQRLEVLELARGGAVLARGARASIACGETRLEVDIPAAAFIADRAQFARLVQNIVANAVKYRKPGRAGRGDDRRVAGRGRDLTLEIADRGVGFDAGVRAADFRALQPAESDVEYAGAGIELAICKSIADRHGWQISVESRPGDGAAFRFVIPTLFAASL